ncbi:DEAD/DEAH box helicase family protein [Candidatus Parcubacteria bacterium]|nr:DEAD/DEAH box helicase family protein [Candidatus Parcubacteria bacterium]
MAQKELKLYQEKAVDKLITRTKELFSENLPKRTIVFQSPTGSGKTFMMSEYIKQIIEAMKDTDLCFLWLSPGKGSLHKQSYKSLKKEFEGYPDTYLLEEEFFGARRFIAKNEVIVANWEKLSQKDSQTGEWKNVLMKDKETINFRELIQGTKENKLKIILVIDESHSRHNAKRAFELREDIICPDLAIEMSATPILKEGEYNEKVSVEPNDVIEQGMIKKEIIINENIDQIDDDEITSQELIMEAAYRKRLEIAKLYKKQGLDINPLVLIQIPVSDAGEDKKDFIESFLAEKGITKDNHKLAVWLNEEKRNQEEGFITKNNNEAEFLIFKQAIDTGWDCPRAQILVRFREIKSLVFEIQTVGRILRMPEAKHYRNDDLNRAYVFTNVKSLVVKAEDYNPNIIKSVFVKRDEKVYKPLKLRSYYRRRIDYGDITANFYGNLENVFCGHFGVKINKAEFGMADKNKKKLAGKIDIKNLDGKDELILNKQIETKYFDGLNVEAMKVDKFWQANLSEEDKERAFENIIKMNLNGFAPKRSLPIVKNSLYRWFKKYIGINLLGNGIIYIQNIVLNNADIFSQLFDKAIKEYMPVKEDEKRQKIKQSEEWDNGWEIADNRNYNPNTHKPFNYKLSLYKSPTNKKAYLVFDSEIEDKFVEFLEKNKDKILWWWQNGNEHMALNFGVKYGEGSTFQPDFIVMFKNGKRGIYDTKAAGYNEGDNKQKSEALQKYIKEENKRNKKDLLVGGIVIKEKAHFLINSDKIYIPFGRADRVKQSGGKKKQNGWRYLDMI